MAVRTAADSIGVEGLSAFCKPAIRKSAAASLPKLPRARQAAKATAASWLLVKAIILSTEAAS